VLVEEGVLSKAKAIEAIETVAELTREMADGNPAIEAHIAADLVRAIARASHEGLTISPRWLLGPHGWSRPLQLRPSGSK